MNKKVRRILATLVAATTMMSLAGCTINIDKDLVEGIASEVSEAVETGDIEIKSNRFDFEPEITAKILKKKARLYELPISYYGREYAEGKKITWKEIKRHIRSSFRSKRVMFVSIVSSIHRKSTA